MVLVLVLCFFLDTQTGEFWRWTIFRVCNIYMLKEPKFLLSTRASYCAEYKWRWQYNSLSHTGWGQSDHHSHFLGVACFHKVLERPGTSKGFLTRDSDTCKRFPKPHKHTVSEMTIIDKSLFFYVVLFAQFCYLHAINDTTELEECLNICKSCFIN